MLQHDITLGNGKLNAPTADVEGEFVTIDGERFYRIAHYDQMPDFFVSIVSDSDHWMFLSSNGALSAGRKDRDNALFPYYTEDKIHDFHGVTGSRTIVRVERAGQRYLWEPFSKPLRGLYNVERHISKSVYGNKIVFEEINHDLKLSFSYGWSNSERFGWVKQSRITSLDDTDMTVAVLDGLGNVLPSEVTSPFQNEYSNLLDGYKKCELLADSHLGLFFLSAIPIDRAEPSESLRATTVWSSGISCEAVLLGDLQIDGFRRGASPQTEWDLKGKRGGYYIVTEQVLSPGASAEWIFVAEVNQTTTGVADLQHWLTTESNLIDAVHQDIAQGTERLRAIVASADGIQASNEELTAARHFSNTLFNIMRGGVYLDNYQVDRRDFLDFVRQTNSTVFEGFESDLATLSERVDAQTLRQHCGAIGNPDLVRICGEYLPLTFSRRHGDPSRPWNQFSIVTKNPDGSPVSDYQGNWRDIFQNWEALSVSYPLFISNIIGKFLNATTADGYNPYRITKEGIDWERPNPEDPWAYIGYWGDHQIIYLQKLLEIAEQYYPGELNGFLAKDIFAYANVPYRIKPYDDIVVDPQNTIDFDLAQQKQIEAKVEQLGADGRLMLDSADTVHHVNMTEKMLVTLLAKLSNFVPEAGIWLNTQRPEWNDANNALVGNGASVVTTCYLRRFLAFWSAKFHGLGDATFPISAEVQDFLTGIQSALLAHEGSLEAGFDNQTRRAITGALGTAGGDYRARIYAQGFAGERASITASELAAFCDLAQRYAEQTIRANEREDGLYHAYNLIVLGEGSLSIRYLYEMLEGQVAVLSSGYLSAERSEQLLTTMKSSRLYRENQYTYMLYPDRELPRFTDKNTVNADAVAGSTLLQQLIADNDRSIVSKDVVGDCHFSSEFHSASYLEDALEKLDKDRYGALVERDKNAVLAAYEAIFDHQSFTGRSGTFYAYEGLGCIYWHMVSKLLLAVNETLIAGFDADAAPAVLDRLKDHYYEIKAGLGLFKSPDLYGAFPIDAYSHTSRDAGVKQPGMTGQVKEDVLSRFAEVGVRVREGVISFDTRLMNPAELLSEPSSFDFINLSGDVETLALAANQLAFSLCQTPVVYTASESSGISLTLNNGEQIELPDSALNADYSASIFARRGEIRRIDVKIMGRG